MDIAILSSKIFTGDPRQPWAEALGIKQNRIAVLGSNSAIKKVCNARTRVLDLKGRLVTPGFVDGHAHFVNLAWRSCGWTCAIYSPCKPAGSRFVWL